MQDKALNFAMQIRVYYEDTDFGGVVYYANYLKFMERARTEYLRSLGLDQSDLLATNRQIFVVKSADIEFVKPARFDDMLTVTASVSKVRRASMQLTQTCSVQTKGVDTVLAASAEVVIACIDADSFKPCAFPASLKKVFDS